ncbi:MAG TPA: urease-associated protein [Alphaproteobacteria bacterium]|nr:urease-associated protein [Alphaproteobacteria bacterium]HAJ48669.1 urease-associated protein [Alphaproteobacteria bacterium]
MRCGLVAAAVVFATLGQAGDASAKLNCKEPMSTADMLQCADQDFQRADKELNAIYAKIMTQLKETYTAEDIKNAGGQDPVADLKDAQRKWIAFRDANCRFMGTQMLGGSGQAPITAGCMARMTEDRVKEFKNYLGE